MKRPTLTHAAIMYRAAERELKATAIRFREAQRVRDLARAQLLAVTATAERRKWGTR